ncbi:MAG: gamma-glutamyltranspeptidase, partial [Actinobacteria bacterium]|nr:gamma-glutamyltranspeptidase [Actinomycetota bacterium]NIS29674.1 gamma-glutamyltranspeptidase [Actinomycetota bacterium]NIT94659.1 gamma-glutamyltranspeptidase [Actinomycetota bacterium]NIU18283.1 gamma-glutamyltranspeptidase [Actinomycetota bacterium]NIU64996.1 gamma-glutamyltranspeptidase [Actinomycetota bacterium]
TSQGYLSLLSAAIADGFDLTGDDGAATHLLVEAAVQAGHDRPVVLHDRADPAELLDPARIA